MKIKLVLSTIILWVASSFAQDYNQPITTIGPIRKTVAAVGRDTIIVSLPPYPGLPYPSCGRIDTVQSFPAGRWSCNPAKAVNWQGFIRASIKKVGGVTSDSVKVSFFYVDDNGFLSGGNAAVYAFGSASTVANVGTSVLSNPSPITLDPAKALALDLNNLNTGGSTRYEIYLDIW